MIESIKHLPAFDIFVVVFLLYCIFLGGKRGIFLQITSIIALVVSWYLASRYGSVLEPYVPLSEVLRKKVSAIGTFVIADIAITLFFGIIGRGLTCGLLKEVNRQIGALFGLAKGIVVCLVLVYFAVTTSNATKNFVLGSQSGRLMARLICELTDKLPLNSHTAKVKTALENFQKEVGQELLQEKTSSDYQISALKKDIASSFQKAKEQGSSLKETVDRLNALSSSINGFIGSAASGNQADSSAPDKRVDSPVDNRSSEVSASTVHEDVLRKTGSLLDSIFSQKSFKEVSPVDESDRSAEKTYSQDVYSSDADNQTYYNPYY